MTLLTLLTHPNYPNNPNKPNNFTSNPNNRCALPLCFACFVVLTRPATAVGESKEAKKKVEGGADGDRGGQSRGGSGTGGQSRRACVRCKCSSFCKWVGGPCTALLSMLCSVHAVCSLCRACGSRICRVGQRCASLLVFSFFVCGSPCQPTPRR
jgi:hypothetical protein